MYGSITTAVAALAPHRRTVSCSTSSAFAWIWWSIVSRTLFPGVSGLVSTTSSARPNGSFTIVWLPGLPASVPSSERSSPSRPLLSSPAYPEHLRRDRPLRVVAKLLRVEAEPGEVHRLEVLRLVWIGLARDVDEPARAVDERRVESGRVEAELLRRRRASGRAASSTWRGLAYTVVASSPIASGSPFRSTIVPRAAGTIDRLAMLAKRHRRVLGPLHDLDPDRAPESAAEEHEEARREEGDAPVGRARSSPRRAGRRSCPRARPGRGRAPSCARRSMRCVAAALEISERSRAMSVSQLGALATGLVELQVQTEHGDVDRDDAGEQHGEEDDPETPPLSSQVRRRVARWRVRVRGARAACATRRHQTLHRHSETRRARARVRRRSRARTAGSASS